MSEDIDIKIVSQGRPPRPALRRLRESITGELLKAGFKFDPENPEHRKSNYASRYTLYRLPYDPIATGQGGIAAGNPYRNLRMADAPAADRPADYIFHRGSFQTATGGRGLCVRGNRGNGGGKICGADEAGRC